MNILCTLVTTDVINLLPLLNELVQLNTARSERLVGICKPRHVYQVDSAPRFDKQGDVPKDRASPLLFSQLRDYKRAELNQTISSLVVLMMAIISLPKYLRQKPIPRTANRLGIH